ncbi:hypothetical protein D0Y50_12550 [Salinimonas sediminis]|uniref:TonB C-terminal domain-containing protein n=2 Tax=Salinimonas sediminis TaxID=2303538 RepID=A0A346NNJ9_9ALTE|nr:hypothetical protein D0Y50_12550 [Salinimonas sediminis]
MMRLRGAVVILGCVHVASANAVLAADNYTSVKLTELNPDAQSTWKRLADEPIHYPRALAFNEVAGCSVVDVTISPAGQLQDIRVVQAQPFDVISLPAAQLIKSWQWYKSDSLPAREENKQIRLDFCYSGVSAQAADSLCMAQVKRACQ